MMTIYRKLAIGGTTNRMIQAWDISSGEILFNICGTLSLFSAIKVFGKSYVAVGSYDVVYNLIIWDLATSSVYRSLVGHTNYIESIEYFTTEFLVRLLKIMTI